MVRKFTKAHREKIRKTQLGMSNNLAKPEFSTREQFGYIYIKIGDKWILEHHYIWCKENECSVPEGFVIHHIDGNKCNNVIENLECMSRSRHAKLHMGTKYFGKNAWKNEVE